MQSATAKTKEWVLEYEPEAPRVVGPLMGLDQFKRHEATNPSAVRQRTPTADATVFRVKCSSPKSRRAAQSRTPTTLLSGDGPPGRTKAWYAVGGFYLVIELTGLNAPMHSSRQLLAGAADAQRSNWKGSVSEVLPPAGWPVCVALGLLTLFLVLRTAATTFLSAAPSLQSYLLVMAASAVAAVAGRDVRAADASPVFARFSGATALGLAIYLLVEPTTYVSARPGTGALAATLRVGDACALVAAVVGLRRPTFLILPAVHVIAARYLAQTVSGLPMARHDVLYLAEAGIFMALAAITLKGVVRTQPVALAGARAYLANCFAAWQSDFTSPVTFGPG